MIKILKYPVEYKAQHYKLSNFNELGFKTEDEAEKWGHNSCGIACVLMAINFFKKEVKLELHDLLKEGLKNSYYSEDKGWLHFGLGNLAQNYGLDYKLKRNVNDYRLIIKFLDKKCLVIASVAHSFPNNGNKSGHLILLSGYQEKNGKTNCFYFLDPSHWGRSNNVIHPNIFMNNFSGNIICLCKNKKRQ